MPPKNSHRRRLDRQYSGYSAEDLVSNLIGFYRAVEPCRQYIRICEPVSKSIALQIWDKYGPVGNNKNYSATPYIYPIPPASDRPMRARLPLMLNTIKPAKQGVLYKEVK